MPRPSRSGPAMTVAFGLLAALLPLSPSFAKSTVKPGDVFSESSPTACRAKLQCRVGEIRTYDYSAVFTTEADLVAHDQSGGGAASLIGEAELRLRTVATDEETCRYEAVLSDVEVAELFRGERVHSARSAEVESEVGEAYYFTQRFDGRILDVTLGREDGPEAATFKRGLINALGATLLDKEAYALEETDMTGTHEAAYARSIVGEAVDYRRTVEKVHVRDGEKNLSAPAAVASQRARVRVDQSACLISEVDIDEDVVAVAPDAGDPAVSPRYRHETITIRAAANLRLLSYGFGPVRAGAGDEGLVTMAVDAPVGSARSLATREDRAEEIESLLKALQSATRSTVRSTAGATDGATAHDLALELSRALHDDSSGLKIVERFLERFRPTGELAAQLGAVLVGDGGEKAQSLFVRLLDDARHGEITRERLLGLSALFARPSNDLVIAVRGLANLESRDGTAATLALGAYAHRLSTLDALASERLTADLESWLTSADQIDATMLYLRALGNAGAESSLPLLRQHLRSSDRLVQLAAIEATRKIPSAEVESVLLALRAEDRSEITQEAIAKVIHGRLEAGLSDRAALKSGGINWNWAQTIGGNLVSADLAMSAQVDGQPYLIDLQAATQVNGPFGLNLNLLDAQLLTRETSAQDRRFRFFIRLAGNDIVNIDETVTCSVNQQNTLWQQSIQIVSLSSGPIPIIGPLVLELDFDLGLDLSIDFFREGDWCGVDGELEMGFTPRVAVTADATVGLSLWLVRGGLGIDGDLIAFELPVYADADLRFQDAATCCFVIDAQLHVTQMELYAWGQVNTVFFGWRPNPRPRWPIVSFGFSPDAWNLFTACDVDPALQCLDDVAWWDGSMIDAWYDGANCYVTWPPAGTTPFISGQNYYIQSNDTCPSSTTWDGTGCFVVGVGEPGIATQLLTNGPNVRLQFDVIHPLGLLPACPSGWTTDSFIPGVRRVCSLTPPAGYSASDYYEQRISQAFVQVYLTGAATCVAGIPDATGCYLGTAPTGTHPFVWSNNFYYAD
ncbi:MAG: HEAT repeat domain-containing protein [Acidobacteriota bacterium]